jgi:hypothetical protein
MPRTFNPSASRPERALQAWLILIGHAADRRTVTYEMLGDQMFGRRAAGVLGTILGCIAYYCEENGFPPLNAIVVRKHRGTPGEGIPDAGDDKREAVYEFPWFDQFPPSPADLEAALERASARADV